MTGRSLLIASSMSGTDFFRPTSMGMMLPGKRTEFRSGRMDKRSGISVGPSPCGWAFCFVITGGYRSSGLTLARRQMRLIAHGYSQSLVWHRLQRRLYRPWATNTWSQRRHSRTSSEAPIRAGREDRPLMRPIFSARWNTACRLTASQTFFTEHGQVCSSVGGDCRR